MDGLAGQLNPYFNYEKDGRGKRFKAPCLRIVLLVIKTCQFNLAHCPSESAVSGQQDT